MTPTTPLRPQAHASAILTVDLTAVVKNWRALKRKLAPNCDTGAVVKADAYGLGLQPVALALKSAGC